MLLLLLLVIGHSKIAGNAEGVDCSLFADCASCVGNKDFCSWNLKNQICRHVEHLGWFRSCEISHPADCSTEVDPKYAYNDSFARNIMYRIAIASNSDNPTICLSQITDDVLVVRRITIDGFASWGKYSVYTAVSNSKKAIMLSFGSSGTFSHIISHIFSIFLPKVDIDGGGKTSLQYLHAFKKLWVEGLKEDIYYLRNRYPDYEYWISGWLSGTALAIIAAHFFVGKQIIKPRKIKITTFGPPRVYDADSARIDDLTLPYSYRVVFADDIIPHIPPIFLGFQNPKNEVWYSDRTMEKDSYVVCTASEDCRCSNSLLLYNYYATLNYFNVHPDKFLSNKCIFTQR